MLEIDGEKQRLAVRQVNLNDWTSISNDSSSRRLIHSFIHSFACSFVHWFFFLRHSCNCHHNSWIPNSVYCPASRIDRLLIPFLFVSFCSSNFSPLYIPCASKHWETDSSPCTPHVYIATTDTRFFVVVVVVKLFPNGTQESRSKQRYSLWINIA